MSFAGANNLAAAEATYQAIFQELFTGEGLPGMAEQMTRIVPVSTKRLSLPIATSMPRIRKWLGEKVTKSIRGFLQDIDVDPWEATIGIDRLDVDGENSGVVESTLRGFLSSQADAFNHAVITLTMLTNPTGYDGVALFSNSHPYSNSTGDNLTSDALSHSSFRALDAAMRGFQDERGRNLGVSPNVLMVGPSLKDTALEVTGADKPIFFNNTGAEATSSVIGGVVIENVKRGSHDVWVSGELTGSEWFLLDTTKPGLSPMLAAEFRKFEAVSQSDMTDESRFKRNEYLFSLEGDYGIAPGLWQLIGGKIS